MTSSTAPWRNSDAERIRERTVTVGHLGGQYGFVPIPSTRAGNPARSSKPFSREVSRASPSEDASGRYPHFFVDFRHRPAGTRLDGPPAGRVESTGCVTSGRRWHRRIPPFVSRFGAAHLSGLGIWDSGFGVETRDLGFRRLRLGIWDSQLGFALRLGSGFGIRSSTPLGIWHRHSHSKTVGDL